MREPSWDEARAVAAAAPALPGQPVALAEADGLVLAEDLRARCALPGFDTSAMDGWAVSGRGPWRLAGEVLAGRPRREGIGPGEAVVIATGGAVPSGARGVIRSEDGHVEQGQLTAPAPPPGSHIRPAGEECGVGDVLARAGTLLTPALVGLAAASGHDQVVAIPRPRAALVLFGDELVDAGVPAPGFVRDSLGPQVPAWITRLGGYVVQVTTSADTLVEHVTAIAAAARGAQVVLTTGGTAAGPVDHLHAAVAALGGELVVDCVAVRPGHPMLLARLPGDTWVLGLPGNPQSAIIALMTLGAPLLNALAGRGQGPDLPTVAAAASIAAPRGETRLVPGRCSGEVFTPAPFLGSAMLRGLAASSGLGVVPAGGVAAGGQVRWLALP